ncbi:hypothetical protein WISP_00759 [Willisornis vidua]|uniref:Secreted protein n=1 Tax=Willisornis vidua TaxID=1566151 RepID=A0ABQ9E1H7_9PASS|nr:hypothetical protein WISP_00759 [Willisornis vidua]
MLLHRVHRGRRARVQVVLGVVVVVQVRRREVRKVVVMVVVVTCCCRRRTAIKLNTVINPPSFRREGSEPLP